MYNTLWLFVCSRLERMCPTPRAIRYILLILRKIPVVPITVIILGLDHSLTIPL